MKCNLRYFPLLFFLLVKASSMEGAEAVYFSLKGRIVDSSTGEAIAGAVVKLDESYLWTISDAEGSYEFDSVQKGDYVFSVSCLGYVDVRRTVSVTADIFDMDVRLKLNTLALNEVVVTAEKSKDDINTTRSLSRNALDHLQISSMSNILALLPGGKTVNPDLTVDNQLSVRAGGSLAGNAAFGTAVEINGVRMGNNGGFGEMKGTGTRNISVENIESVEVITGVPSAEYGDLNSGMVKVTTKKGRTPVNVVFSVNPRTWNASVSKGFDLGQDKGTLNVNAEYARAMSQLVSPYTSYTRRGFGLEYSNLFYKVLRLEAGLTGNVGGMYSRNDPDLFSNEYEKSKDNVLTPHFKLSWLLNKSWITNLTLDCSVYYHDEYSIEHKYNSFASYQPSINVEEDGYFMAESKPLTFYSDHVVDSKELDYAASLKYNWLRRSGKVKNLLKAGVQWKSNGNVGKGEYYLDAKLAANGYRPTWYADYPYMHNLSAYIEDNLTFPVGKTSFNLSAGLRLESVFIKGTQYDKLNTLSPRLNAQWKLSEHFSLRGGWGVAQKLPSFYILYPRPEYEDFQTFSFSTGQQDGYVYYVKSYHVNYNPDLKWQKNYNAEIGVDASFSGFKISLVGYRNVTRDPYEFANEYVPFSYRVMQKPAGFVMPDVPQVKVDHQTGDVYVRGADDEFWTMMETKNTNGTFVNYKRQNNGDDVVRSGLELTVDFPEIKAIRTSFRLDASYGHTRYVNNTPYYHYASGWSHTSLPDRSYQYVGVYAGDIKTYNGEQTDNIDANLTVITHIPQARLIITCRIEAALMRHSRNLSEYQGKDYAFTVGENSILPTGGDIYDGNSYTAIYPIAYVDLNGVEHPFTEAEASDPEFARLVIRSNNIYTFAKDGYDPYFSANLSVTKEIGDHVSFSFFANNFTNSRRFVKSYATGVAAIFTPAFYYGLTCRLKF